MGSNIIKLIYNKNDSLETSKFNKKSVLITSQCDIWDIIEMFVDMYIIEMFVDMYMYESTGI